MNSLPGDSATMLKIIKPKYFVNMSLNSQEIWKSWDMILLMLTYQSDMRMLVVCEVKIMENIIVTHRKSLYPVRWCKYNLAIEQFSPLKHVTNAFRLKMWVSGQFDLSSRLKCTLKWNCCPSTVEVFRQLQGWGARELGITNINGIEYWASAANETFRCYQFCLCFQGQIFVSDKRFNNEDLVMYTKYIKN